MPKSKNRPEQKAKAANFKTKNKKQMTEMNNAQQLPPVRSIPVWGPDSKIEISGYEWEAIQNGLGAVQIAQQAGQAVMSRNMLTGVITMDFEKLNPQTLEYGPMTDEEKAPYLENFQKAIQKVKENPNGVPQEPVSDTGLNDVESLVGGEDGLVDLTGAPLTQESAKIITMPS